MPLYSSFNTSQYYDDEEESPQKPPEYKKPHQSPTELSSQKKKSLYAEAQAIVTSIEEYSGPDFRDIYKVGQMVSIKGANGIIRTNKGKIAEIVAQNLMYVYMEDSHKDVNNQWLADFVTDKDTITRL
mgnify:CR=1 FL=1|jgi:hypothetical protein